MSESETAAGRVSAATTASGASGCRVAVHPQPPLTGRKPERASLDGVRLLLVEDEASSRDVLRRMLEESGAVVVTASSAVEALHSYRNGRPDVVVSDIAMPGMDGYELIRELRRDDGAARRIPAIALTAYAQPVDRERALSSGFDAHVAKPIDPDHLVEAVLRSLAGRGTPVPMSS